MATSFWDDPFLWYQEKVNPAPKVNGDLKAEVLAKVESGAMTPEAAAPYLKTADQIASDIARIRAAQIQGTKEAFSASSLVGDVTAPVAGLAKDLTFLLLVAGGLYLVVTGQVRLRS